jgi:hypothetical protein
MRLYIFFLRLLVVEIPWTVGSLPGISFHSGGYNSLDLILKERILLDNGGLIVEFILFDKFLDDGHEFGFIGLGEFEVFLHDLNFHIDGSDSLLFLG